MLNGSQPQDWRRQRIPGTAVTGSTVSPRRIFIIVSIPVCPTRKKGWADVVMDGSLNCARRISSYPVTITSPGTLMPRFSSAWMTPMAV